MKQIISSVALTLYSFVFLSSTVCGYTDIQKFFNNLESKGYDKKTAPEGSNGPGSPVNVIVSAYILDINKVDSTDMEFNAHFYFRQYWNDSRLEHKNSERITLRDEEAIWTPDLFFIEERKGSIHQVMNPNKFIKIKSNGEVQYSVRLRVTFRCPMDLRNFPHDIQKCTLNIESYGFQRSHINLEWKNPAEGYDPISASEEIELFNFDLIDITPTSRNISMAFGEYKTLQINLKFKRKFGFLAMKLYVPYTILVLMSLFSLWIKAEERYIRLCFLLVIFYLMVTISTEVDLWIPAAPYTKASDVWIGCCGALVFATFLEFIVVALIAGKNNGSSNAEGEILPTLNSETKDLDISTDSLKSPLSKFIAMFNARNGGQGRRNTQSHRIDKICRIVFPIIFILFHIVYWSVYTTA